MPVKSELEGVPPLRCRLLEWSESEKESERLCRPFPFVSVGVAGASLS
jgi:hypothetical protein